MKLMYMLSAVSNIASHVLQHVHAWRCVTIGRIMSEGVRPPDPICTQAVRDICQRCHINNHDIQLVFIYVQNNRLASYPARGYVHGLLAACYRARWLRRSWQCLTEPKRTKMEAHLSPRAERQAILERSIRKTSSQTCPRWKSQFPSLDI